MCFPRVLYILNGLDATSIPQEVADYIDSERFDLTVVAYYRSSELPGDPIGSLIGIDARSMYDLRAFWALYRLIQKERPDVIHVHHTLSSVLGSLLGRLLRAPVIIRTEHSDHRYKSFGQNLLNAVSIALVDGIICNSNYTSRSFWWWEKLLARKKRVTIYNGVDIHKIDHGFVDPAQVRRQIGVQTDDFVIGNVGRLIREKDQALLIRAMEIVVKNMPRAKLIIVGGGPLQTQLVSLVKSLGLEEHVIFTGGVGRSRVYEILHALDVFVMSSLWEGFCNAVVEAMAASKPIVATNVGALPEVVGTVGKFVPPRSPKALAEAILDLAFASPDERRHLGQAGRRRVEENFTVWRTAQKYSQLYLKLLIEKGRISQQQLGSESKHVMLNEKKDVA